MPQSQMVKMQGIDVPASSVNPEAFFKLTRRLRVTQKTFAWAGFGFTDAVTMRQTGIIYGINIKASGSLVVALPTGTVASTPRWPYDLAKAVRFAANGQSNLINVSGAKLKAREMMSRGDLSDRGVTRGIGGASPGTQVSQGTMSMNSESWGVGQNVSAIAAGTYGVELEWYVPVAFDNVTLLGAIFAQTSATALDLNIDWAPITDMFTITGTATATLTLTVVVQALLCDIPEQSGQVIVPDLSTFHSLIQTRYTAVGNGPNEINLSGQAIGRQLLRIYWQLWNNGAPLPVNATNYAAVGWRFGANDTPELFPDGRALNYEAERIYDADLGTFQGIAALDFCQENAFRDSIDEGTATEIRIYAEIPTGVALVAPFLEYVQEVVSVGAAA